MNNVEIIDAAAQALLIRAQASGPPLPLIRHPEYWPDGGSIDLTYQEGYMVSMRPANHDSTLVEVVEVVESGAGRMLASQVVRDYDSPDTLADRIEAIYAAARSGES